MRLLNKHLLSSTSYQYDTYTDTVLCCNRNLFKRNQNAIGSPNDPRARYVRPVFQNESYEKATR